jgi:putative oxidoreductase
MATVRSWNRSEVEVKDVATLPTRLALGSAMLYHGASKLKPGAPEATAQFFESAGIRPGKFWAMGTGVAEVLSGVGAIAGIGTRLAALAVLVTQAVAIAKVHRTHGYDMVKGGYEYNLALMGIAAGLLAAGPGRLSAHSVAEHRARRTRHARRERLIRWLK